MIIAGLIILTIIGITVKLFDENIRKSKLGKPIVVYGFFLSLALILGGIIGILIK